MQTHPCSATPDHQLVIIRPDDWHLHVRDGTALAAVLPDTVQQFSRAIIMPNLPSAATTVAAALAYRERILAVCPAGSDFEPLMTLYLTDRTTDEEIYKAQKAGIAAVKLYPAGATTHAEAGVTDLLKHCVSVLEALEKTGMPLLMHGEVTDPAVDIFDRETQFIVRVLRPLLDRFPTLRVVFEHITTAEAVDFVRSAPDNVAATVTAHHLLLNRNALFHQGLCPHHYCLPILKSERHRKALVEAVVSGDPHFFLGTDSAPHSKTAKESACGCAGIYTAHAALPLYLQVFEKAQALTRFEAFASVYGPRFYRLPVNQTTLRLERRPWRVPETLAFGSDTLVPFYAGKTLQWSVAVNA